MTGRDVFVPPVSFFHFFSFSLVFLTLFFPTFIFFRFCRFPPKKVEKKFNGLRAVATLSNEGQIIEKNDFRQKSSFFEKRYIFHSGHFSGTTVKILGS